jgi:hypothetical protein
MSVRDIPFQPSLIFVGDNRAPERPQGQALAYYEHLMRLAEYSSVFPGQVFSAKSILEDHTRIKGRWPYQIYKRKKC